MEPSIVFLCAGQSSRMQTLLHKSFALKIDNETLFERLYRQFSQYYKNFALVHNPFNFNQEIINDINIKTICNYNFQNESSSSVKLAREILNNDIIFVDGDIITNKDTVKYFKENLKTNNTTLLVQNLKKDRINDATKVYSSVSLITEEFLNIEPVFEMSGITYIPKLLECNFDKQCKYEFEISNNLFDIVILNHDFCFEVDSKNEFEKVKKIYEKNRME